MSENNEQPNYHSAIAESIEASGNFINSIRNPWFVIVLILMIGGGYIFYKATYVISDSIDRLSSKLEMISNELNEQKLQTQKEIELLNIIADN